MVASFPARIMFIIGIAAAVLDGDRSAEVMHEHYAYVAEGNPGLTPHQLGDGAEISASAEDKRQLTSKLMSTGGSVGMPSRTAACLANVAPPRADDFETETDTPVTDLSFRVSLHRDTPRRSESEGSSTRV
ncbi:hypothetical protein FOZ63_001530 [Perkinsus olseni]|uniref:Uncharacterized protein n=1 Tax=Perkinsus olseni TaxID=32597 RepID=A0A7J6QGM3_PEROL|nr:hypothetical protein FOZ62_031985 [Perkinsus olseni]KAF4754369.1 hypothetical protein FOZ63_001530 [Perkinsus olseni]